MSSIQAQEKEASNPPKRETKIVDNPTQIIGDNNAYVIDAKNGLKYRKSIRIFLLFKIMSF